MERKLKAALVGVGSMGRGHLDNYVKFLKEDSPIQIVALCDVDEKKFTNYKADFNLGEVGADGYDFNMFRLYNDLDKMLEMIEQAQKPLILVGGGVIRSKLGRMQGHGKGHKCPQRKAYGAHR